MGRKNGEDPNSSAGEREWFVSFLGILSYLILL